jgi:hypothetical protein
VFYPTALFARQEKDGYSFWGYERRAGGPTHAEKLDYNWVQENLLDRGYADFVKKLQEQPNQPRHLPKGSAEKFVEDLGVVASKSGSGVRTDGLTRSVVPSVHFQGDQPYCTSFAVASALRHVRLDGLATFILEQKERLLRQCPCCVASVKTRHCPTARAGRRRLE